MEAIKIPAIRAELGTLVYYTSTFTFKQIAERVKRIEDELHTSLSLKTQLQRTLTDNYKSISDYILMQSEHFFNSIVLAVYDGDPEWNEVEIEFENQDFYNMGFLTLSGGEKIFPVDGQHRVEGIKDALSKNPSLEDEMISVILIGHQTTREGMERTRRIFSTLNRYAKPVQLGDIIALDEDDIVAIVTRDLLESYPLFMNNKIRSINNKALSENDFDSFTSLITLYQCNVEIFRNYKSIKDQKKYTIKSINQYLKFRPVQKEIDDFKTYLVSFWDTFCNSFEGMTDFRDSNEKNAAKIYRNRDYGGLLYFRPVALPPLIKSILETCRRTNMSQEMVMQHYSTLKLHLNDAPWVKLLWEPITRTMNMINETFIRLLLMFMFDKNLLTKKELNELRKKYAAATDIDLDSVDFALNSFRSTELC